MKTQYKKVILIALIVIVCVVCVFILNRNYFISSRLMSGFEKTVCDDFGYEIMDTASTYGKLNGNGNGISFFGAVLVKADSAENINELVSELEHNYDIVGYSVQSGQKLDCRLLEHVSLSYGTFPEENENLYTVYYFTSADNASLFDIRGH